MDSKFENMETLNVDSRTGSVKGSETYNNYYFPKFEKNEIPAASLIDSTTGSVKGSETYNNYYFPKIEKNEKSAAPLIDEKTGFIVGSKEYNDYYCETVGQTHLREKSRK